MASPALVAHKPAFQLTMGGCNDARCLNPSQGSIYQAVYPGACRAVFLGNPPAPVFMHVAGTSCANTTATFHGMDNTCSLPPQNQTMNASTPMIAGLLGPGQHCLANPFSATAPGLLVKCVENPAGEPDFMESPPPPSAGASGASAAAAAGRTTMTMVQYQGQGCASDVYDAVSLEFGKCSNTSKAERNVNQGYNSRILLGSCDVVTWVTYQDWDCKGPARVYHAGMLDWTPFGTLPPAIASQGQQSADFTQYLSNSQACFYTGEPARMSIRMRCSHTNTTGPSLPVTMSTQTAAGGSFGSQDSSSGGSSAYFTSPRGVALDAAREIAFVADTNNHAIRKLDLNHPEVVAGRRRLGGGPPPMAWGTTLAGVKTVPGAQDGPGTGARFNKPYGIALPVGQDFVVVADSGNHAIRKVTLSTGKVETLAGLMGTPGNADGVGTAARFNSPTAVFIGAASDQWQGSALVADNTASISGTIRKVNYATGAVTTLVDNTATAHLFNEPHGVLGAADFVLVAEKGASVISKIDTATNTVSVIVGSKGAHGSVDGVGAAARLNRPEGIAMDASLQVVFVADTGNHVIRRLVLATNKITTVAGLMGKFGDKVDGIGVFARFYNPTSVAVAAGGRRFALVADSGANGIRVISACEPGTRPGATKVGCVACPSGQHQANAGQEACDMCEAGRFRTAASPTEPWLDACHACPAQEYQSSAGQLQCLRCARQNFRNVSESAREPADKACAYCNKDHSGSASYEQDDSGMGCKKIETTSSTAVVLAATLSGLAALAVALFAAHHAKKMKAARDGTRDNALYEAYVPPKDIPSGTQSQQLRLLKLESKITAGEELGLVHPVIEECFQAVKLALDQAVKSARPVQLRAVARVAGVDHRDAYLACNAIIKREEEYPTVCQKAFKAASQFNGQRDRRPSLVDDDAPRPCRQQVGELPTLYLQARETLPKFQKVFENIVSRFEEHKTAKGKPAVVMHVSPLKHIYRIMEKMCLKATGRWRYTCFNVCDVVRCIIECNDCKLMGEVIDMLLNDCGEQLSVVRVKDRANNLTSMGWMDVMINIILEDDSHAHVCEVQVVHSKMMMARAGLGGHGPYSKWRAATEILAVLGLKADRPAPIKKLRRGSSVLNVVKVVPTNDTVDVDDTSSSPTKEDGNNMRIVDM